MKKDCSFLTENIIAHRGMHDIKEGIPENSMIAFEKAIQNNYIIELDVHILKDGNVVVFHDDNLKRLTNMDVMIKDMNYNELKSKYDENQKVVEEYQNSSSTNNSLIASMKNQIDYLSLLSGTTDVKGEGVIITLSDGETPSDTSTRTDTLVHDSDVLTVVNELKAAGAEAISVNGQRIISTSAIRCVGPVIQVNYQKVAAPFTIKAIGNSQYLESAMNIKNGVADTLKDLGVQVEVVREKEIKIEKFNGSFSLKNATVSNENQK